MNSRFKAVLAVGALALSAGIGCTGGMAIASQPHMGAALSDLQAARSELQVAEENKGGHRAIALNLVNQAINEVQAGIAVGAGY